MEVRHMIALLFYGVIALWALVAIYLGCKFPRWFKLKQAWALLFTPLVFFAPVIDEFIGRWQFKRLCKKEAVIWLSPNWMSVEAVRETTLPSAKAKWAWMPIRIQRYEYVDAVTGKPFMSSTYLSTKGGLLLGTFGFGLDGITSCKPKNLHEIYKMIDIDALIQKGKSK
jgi:hypothetical protein